LRKAINKLLESSELVYINDMTYICVSKWKLNRDMSRFLYF
jgi:hypothetical protein